MDLRGDHGFTLVETLVAFVIMAAVTTMLYRGVSNGLRASRVADRAEAALLVATARIATLGVETPLQEGRLEGRDGEFAWDIAIRPYLAADGADSAARLEAFWATVTVTWAGGRTARRSLQLTTLKLRDAR